MTPEWANVVVAAVAATVAFAGVVVAWWQLSNLNGTLRLSGLLTVLQLAAEMNSRKQRVDEINREIAILAAKQNASKAALSAFADEFDAAMENWINSADRLAFCIYKGYVKEAEWKTEYRNYFLKLLVDHPKYFGPGSPYHNLIDLTARWQRG
jgi:hypothetical protein